MSGANPDEFETIALLLSPLATDPAARGLKDDVAVLHPPPGRAMVLTHDTIVEGVHFLASDPPGTVAQKLLRVNLSDLAAKGADPAGYLLSCAWSERCDWAWREAFAAGLAKDQARFGLSLLGGDTVSTPGPLTLGATLIGWADSPPSRAGAARGDRLFVTGPIGDGRLGLEAALGRLTGSEAEVLIDHYRRPTPRLDCLDLVRRFATATADISDGLIADAGRIAVASGLGVRIDLDRMPLSAAAAGWLAEQPDPAQARAWLATGGDDYQIALSIAPAIIPAAEQAARALGVALHEVGVFDGDAANVLFEGRLVEINEAGWQHR